METCSNPVGVPKRTSFPRKNAMRRFSFSAAGFNPGGVVTLLYPSLGLQSRPVPFS